MNRLPRLTAPLTLLALGALLLASAATGRSTSKPVQQQEPAIISKNAVVVGSTLTANKGSWSGTQPLTYSYQWRRCNGDALNCSNIANANDLDYKIVDADAGHTLRFQVKAKNADGETTGLSNATGQVPGKANAPSELTLPTISGSVVVGEKLTASHGTWQGTQPITYEYRWQTCNEAATACAGNGTSGSSYTVAKADVGKRLRVKVTAKNTVGETTGVSAPTDVAKDASGGGGGGTPGTAIPVADVGPAGERLIVDQVTFNPNPVTSRNQQITVRIRVKDTNGRLVRGALVSIQSTPVVASIPTPAPTGEDGGVTYTLQPEGDFPIKNGYSVQFFVKAYRQGDPSLAGISGTRLVQVATKKP